MCDALESTQSRDCHRRCSHQVKPLSFDKGGTQLRYNNREAKVGHGIRAALETKLNCIAALMLEVELDYAKETVWEVYSIVLPP